MSSLSRFMNSFLTPSQVSPGRLVLDPSNPSRNFCAAASNTLQLGPNDVSRAEFSSVYALTNSRSSSSFHLSLTKFLAAFARKTGATVDSLSSGKAVSYELLNVDSKLEDLLQSEDVRKWIEKYRQRSRVYMVVAVHTVEDAAATLDYSSTSSTGVEATVPVSAAAAATVAPGASATPVGKTLDAKFSASSSLLHQGSASFVAPGERIISVGYQEVVLRTFFSRDVDPPVLARKTVWNSFDASRGGGADEEEEVPDMVEASVGGLGEARDIGRRVKVAAEVEGPRGRFVILEDQVVG